MTKNKKVTGALFEGYDWRKTLSKGVTVFLMGGAAMGVNYFLQAVSSLPANSIWEVLIVGVLVGGLTALKNYIKNKDN